MRLGPEPSRCRIGLAKQLPVGLIKTRCRLHPGHGGPHVGPHLPELPYNTIRWFNGTEGQFISDRNIQYAWKGREKKAS